MSDIKREKEKKERKLDPSRSSLLASSAVDIDYSLDKKKIELQAEIFNLEKKKEELKKKCHKLEKSIDEKEFEIQALQEEQEDVSADNLAQKMKVQAMKTKRTCKVDCGHIEIAKQLPSGSGGTTVYTCLVDGWNCAVKELSKETVDQSSEQSFDSEITLLEKLPTHPNICKYLFHTRDGKTIRLFMTRYDDTLGAYIQQHMKQNPSFYFGSKEIARFSMDIVKGLDFLHSKKIIHRDLKPGNIFIQLGRGDEVQKCVIGDFDSAKKISMRNKAVTIIGTERYMAPEVLTASSGGCYDFSVDVYSFGLILYVMLTRQEPFHGERPTFIPELIVKGKIPEIKKEVLCLDSSYKEFEKIYLKCCNKNPSERPNLGNLKMSFAEFQF